MMRLFCLLVGLLLWANAVMASHVVMASQGKVKVLHPIERIAYSDDWREITARTVPEGGHAFVIISLRERRCAALSASVEGVGFFTMFPTVIDTPSSAGGRTGVFYEVLIPRNDVNCALSDYIFVEWVPLREGTVTFTAEGESVQVEVRFEGRFEKASRPFFVGLTNAYLWRAHCGGYCRKEAVLGHLYADLLVKHHLTPIHNWVALPPIRDGRLDLDAGKGGASFRHQVMHYSPDRVAFPPARLYGDPVAYLKALEKTVQEDGLTGRAWVFVRDEPTDLDAVADELALYARHAPSVLSMVTRPWDERLAGDLDIFSPVINWLGRDGWPGAERYRGKELWPYASCMGSCGPNRAGRSHLRRVPGPDTGLPDFLIDRPAGRLFAYFHELERIDAGAGFYYEATEGFKLMPQGVDLYEDPWNFGGNGDGLLVYPGRPGAFGFETDMAFPSMRLKLIHHATEAYWRWLTMRQ